MSPCILYQKNQCNEFEKERLQKQRKNNENKLKQKKRHVKRRKLNNSMKVTEYEGFPIERDCYIDIPYTLLKQSQYPKTGTLIETLFPNCNKWYLGEITKIIKKRYITVKYISDGCSFLNLI